jgi:DNA replication protein DnaC
MEVLFTLLAERYERKSVVITTNLVFSEWDRIFKDPMTTLAAIEGECRHPLPRRPGTCFRKFKPG